MKKLTKPKRIVLVITGAIILIIIGYFVSIPISSSIEHDRFSALDKNQSDLYKNLVDASAGTDNWTYLASCKQIYTGDIPTGTYDCSTVISTEKQTKTVAELNDLQTKYFPVIDSYSGLKQKTPLNKQLAGDFGINFVVSGAEKNYTDTKSGFTCNYLIKIYQTNKSIYNIAYGSPIDGGTGRAIIKLECRIDTANTAWYPLIGY